MWFAEPLYEQGPPYIARAQPLVAQGYLVGMRARRWRCPHYARYYCTGLSGVTSSVPVQAQGTIGP